MKMERNLVFTCTELPEKERRNLTIFDLIRTKGSISKPEISKLTGINIVSVSNYIENYIARKLVSERCSEVSSGGRKPDLVALNKDDTFVAGVGLDVSSAQAVVTDLAGRELARSGPAAVRADDPAAAGAGLAAMLAELQRSAGVPGIAAVGIGAADSICRSSLASIGRATHPHAYVGDAAHCAAYGEAVYNAAASPEDLLYVHTDLGRCIVMKGGRSFGAVQPDGAPPAPAGAAGENGYAAEMRYLEPWDESLGIVHAATQEVCRGVGTKIVDASHGKAENISVAAVIDAARRQDAVAADILKSAGANLGLRIAYLINVFGPKAVIIGGGLEAAGGLILDPIQTMVNRFAFTRQAQRVSIVPGTLGPDAVSRGAAALAVREVFLRV